MTQRKLKHEGIPVGNHIRAYDFDPAMCEGKQYFVEGEIVGTIVEPYKAYVIKVTHDTCAPLGARNEVLVPYETSMFEYDARVLDLGVRKLSRH